MTVDALVVGAGPAGCAAATRLARDGAQVVLVHRRQRNQRSSEVLPGSAGRLLLAAGLGAVEDLAEGRCGGTLSAWGAENLVASDTFASPDGAGWWIDRARFDSVLRRRSAGAGVTVLRDPVRALRRDGRRWVADLGRGRSVTASWVIDSTGRAAAVARQMGAVRRYGPRLVAVHARTVEGQATAPARIFLEAQRDGWWYVGASAQRRISAVAAVLARDARRLIGGFPAGLRSTQHLTRWADQPGGWTPPKVSPAGTSFLHAVCADRWIACGDAAIAFDPLSSQGLVGALASGLTAAHAVCSDNTGAALADIAARHSDVLRIYEARRSAAYAREYRWPNCPFWSAQRDSLASARWPAEA